MDAEWEARQAAKQLQRAAAGSRRLDAAGPRGYSPDHFGRTFRRVHGEPLGGFIRRLSLERAARELRRSASPVWLLAFQAGFGSPEAFCRAFRAAYGRSPRAYRADAGPVRTLLPAPSRLHAHEHQLTTMIRPKLIPFAAKPAAGLVHVGETPDIAATWQTLNRLTAAEGWRRPETRYFTRCLDDPAQVGPEQIRYECLFTTPSGFVPPASLHRSELPDGEYAVFVHQGPDDEIVDTWARAFTDWLPASGREFNGVCFEEYVNGFYEQRERADEPLIVTAVYLGLKS